MDALVRAGIWDEAAEFRENERQRLRETGKTREESVEGSWDAMAEKYVPNAEEASPAFQVILPDGAKCYGDIVDPDYDETNDAVQMKGAYRWIKNEFPRVVADGPNSTVVDYRLFQTPPPIELACNILETWASKPRAKRDGLYRELRVWLASGKSRADSEPEEEAGLCEVDKYMATVAEGRNGV